MPRDTANAQRRRNSSTCILLRHPCCHARLSLFDYLRCSLSRLRSPDVPSGDCTKHLVLDSHLKTRPLSATKGLRLQQQPQLVLCFDYQSKGDGLINSQKTSALLQLSAMQARFFLSLVLASLTKRGYSGITAGNNS